MLHGPRCLLLLPLQPAASRIFRREDASCRRRRHWRSRERNGEIPREPHCLPQQCLSQVADLLRRVQRAICRAARSNACTIYTSTGRRPFSAGKADIFRRRLFEALELWYARFPACRTRGCSLLVERSRASAGGEPLDDPKAKEPASGPARSRCWPPCWGAQGTVVLNKWMGCCEFIQ